MTGQRDSDWFSIARQPQEPLAEDGATLTGDELERWKDRFKPLLRHLRGRQVLLALSGGGMALPCHISVIKVLELLDVKISGVYGTSAGAVVGGLYAAGISADQLGELVLKIDDPNKLFGFAARHPALRLAFNEIARAFAGDKLSRSAIYDAERAEKYVGEALVHYLGKSPRMSELKMPFSCVAFDVGTAKPSHHGEEMASKCAFSVKNFANLKLADAIAASMAIPGTFPPKRIDGHYYLDGSVVEALPVPTAFDDWASAGRLFRRNTTVIASDLGYADGSLDEEQLRDPIAVARYAGAVQGRATTVYSLLDCHRPGSGFSVILVSPKTLTVRLWDVEKIPAAMKTAYEHTVRQLSDDRFMALTEEYVRGSCAFLGLSTPPKARLKPPWITRLLACGFRR
jgi:predicted acylesterase/phospholipase RssA